MEEVKTMKTYNELINSLRIAGEVFSYLECWRDLDGTDVDQAICEGLRACSTNPHDDWREEE
jgi:hypothetical protein